jgi:hypothetical protein
MLMDTSALILLTNATLKLPAMLKPDLQSHERMLREHILYLLDTLPKVPRLPGPKFVFAHIVSPHSPYIFGPDGEQTGSAALDTIVGYTNQVKYLNKRILPLLDDLSYYSPFPSPTITSPLPRVAPAVSHGPYSTHPGGFTMLGSHNGS